MTRDFVQVRCGFIGLTLVMAAAALTASPPEGVPGSMIGQKSADFTLPDLHGKPWSLHQQKVNRALVLAFVSVECPMSNDYLQRLAQLAKSYESKGVALALINANPEEDAKSIASHAKEFGIALPVLRDEKQLAVAAVLKAEINPSVYVLDAGFTVRYQGRIDDSYVKRLVKGKSVTRNDLQIALDELLAGKPVSVPVTKPLGCPIQVKAVAAKAATDDVSPRRAADPAEPLPGLPSARRGRAVLAHDLQAGRQVGRATSRSYTQSPQDAAVEAGRRARPFHNDRRLTRQGDRARWPRGWTAARRKATRRTRRRRGSSPTAGSSASRTWS